MQRAKRGFAGIPFSKTQLALALAAFGVAAQAAPVGPEFRVNSYTTGSQNLAATAMDQDGDFVVVWDSYAQDGSYSGIFAQRFDSTGVAQGGEFQVNTFTTGWQVNPAVAMDQDGDFVVVWSTYDGPGGDGYDVYARRYNAAGVPQGDEFLVNTTTAFRQGSPSDPASVAMDQDGDFVVAWLSDTEPSYYQQFGIFAQRFDETGARQGGEFALKDFTYPAPARPAVALDQDGDLVVVWISNNNTGDGGVNVYARRFNALDVPSEEFVVSGETTSSRLDPAVAMDQDGDFVVAWKGRAFADDVSFDIFAHRFNAAGAPQGIEFQVSAVTTGETSAPAVVADQDGAFTIVWSEFGDGDGDESGVFGRSFDASGVAEGTEFPVNTYTTSSQGDPAIAMNQDGDFVVAWGSYLQDGSNSGIYAQRFTPILAPALVNSRFAAPTLSGKSTSDTPVPEGLAGTYQFTSKFCLNAGTDVTDLFSRTKQLSNNNSLISRTRDAPAAPLGGAGSEQGFPLNLGYADGLLSTSECVNVTYQIGLASKASFTFRIDLYGNEAP